MPSNAWTALLWFAAIIVLIPVSLWLLKRTPMGNGTAHALMRSVAVLPLSANQRIVTVEVGHGEARQWLVLGVTAQSITTLHTMAPDTSVDTPAAAATPGFAQLLARLRPTTGAGVEH
jgi:flagellar protein FliO/FliZ